jgi:hypothetical protein
VQISNWKKQLLEGAPGLFADRRTRQGGSGQESRQQQPPVEELYQQIGRLQFELEWLKIKSRGLD